MSRARAVDPNEVPAEDFDGYGPRHAAALWGHEEAEARLLALWNSGRMPHALMLAGPSGIGKATLAYRFARFVLKQGEQGGAGEGLFGAPPPATSLQVAPEDPVFRRVAALGHADLCAVERGWNEKSGRFFTEIRIHEARRMKEFFTKTAGEGAWRVAVIDALDQMNRNAANALLKTLEEPPKRALLLLVCHAPGRQLATIRSRCAVLSLRPLRPAAMDQVLSRLLPDLDPDQRQALIGLAEGRPGRAAALHGAGGVALYRELIGLIESLPRLDAGALHALGDRLARRDQDGGYATLVDLLLGWLARLARFGALGAGAEVLPGEDAAMARLVGAQSLDRWVELWEKLARLFDRADAVNLDRKQTLLAAFGALERAARGGAPA
ncbi:MAG: DNA polymerase III subunit delta' [Alphaproteobacteria bacterium]|nr:DNA polymerase III subunit delta' [Alphaproteobacteria bacterium]